VRDEVFQVSELVEPYRVAPSIDLEENSNFHVFDDSLIDVDVEEFTVVFSSSGQANVDEMMIFILKITIKLITIQLTMNYQNHIKCKSFFYNLIYIMDDIL